MRRLPLLPACFLLGACGWVEQERQEATEAARSAAAAHVVPEVSALLEELGRRFQERLAEMGAQPPSAP